MQSQTRTDKEITGGEGILWDGKLFEYPYTEPQFIPHVFTDPLTVLEYVSIALMLLQLYFFQYALAGFIFWKAAYLLILGYGLKYQSIDKRLVYWLEQLNMGQKLPCPPSDYVLYWRNQVALYMERCTGSPYDYTCMPIEFNAWILFRQVSDLLTANAIVAYFLLVFKYYYPNLEYFVRHVTHIIGGSAFLLFNVWIRSDMFNSLDDFSCCTFD